MGNYSDEFKNSMITKMTAPQGRSATSLSQEVGIPQSTLSRWLRERSTLVVEGDGMTHPRADAWSAEEKLAALVEYGRLPEEERGKYLRGKGLHEAHLQRWTKEFIEGHKLRGFVGGKKDPQQKRIAVLEKELKRKESALVEAATLLVLKKKADAIWGEDGDKK